MGKPTAGNAAVSRDESIVTGSEPGEVKHLSTRRKIKQTAIPLVVASERGTGQWSVEVKQNGLESPAKAGDSPVYVNVQKSLSKAGHVKSCLNLRGPSRKAKYYLETDSGQVPRGKGEKNPC